MLGRTTVFRLRIYRRSVPQNAFRHPTVFFLEKIFFDAFLVLNFLLDGLNGVRALHLQRDRLSSKSFDKYLHRKGFVSDSFSLLEGIENSGDC